MTKIIISILFLFSIVLAAKAQQSKLFVSLDGGSTSLFRFGKIAYKSYYFTSNSPNYDTLICSGSGRILPEVDIKGMAFTDYQEKVYSAFNEVIKKTIHKAEKENTESGVFTYFISEAMVKVKYRRLDSGVLKMKLIYTSQST